MIVYQWWLVNQGMLVSPWFSICWCCNWGKLQMPVELRRSELKRQKGWEATMEAVGKGVGLWDDGNSIIYGGAPATLVVNQRDSHGFSGGIPYFDGFPASPRKITITMIFEWFRHGHAHDCPCISCVLGKRCNLTLCTHTECAHFETFLMVHSRDSDSSSRFLLQLRTLCSGGWESDTWSWFHGWTELNSPL